MATVDIEIAARTYPVSCRDGEEPQLRALAALVDRKAKDAAAAVGNMGESRQLLFASLLLADELQELRSGAPAAAAAEPQADPAVAKALEQLAERMEMLADRLESKA
jgi:cell division protein ZapA